MNSRNFLEETIVTSLANEQYVFYGHIISSCKIHLTDDISKMPAPAGVNFSGGQFNLFINTSLFNKYALKERIAILVHESLHIILNHTGRKKNKDHKLWNIACDIAINQFIKNLPTDGCTYKKFNFEKGLSAENYYSLLREKQEKKDIEIKVQMSSDQRREKDGAPLPPDEEKDKGPRIYAEITNRKTGKKEYVEIDPHSSQDEGSDTDETIVEMIRQRMIDRAIEKSRGSVPGDVMEEIEKMKSKEIDWKKIIKSGMSNTVVNVEETIKRRNRRFIGRPEIRGFIKTPSSCGVVILDTSGSMNCEFISKNIGEISNLCNSTGAECILMQVDTEVHEIKEFNPKNKTFKIKGRGGTCLYPAIEKILEKKIKCDWIVVITDGEIETSWKQWIKVPHYFLLPKGCKLKLNILNLKAKIFNV